VALFLTYDDNGRSKSAKKCSLSFLRKEPVLSEKITGIIEICQYGFLLPPGKSIWWHFLFQTITRILDTFNGLEV